MGNTYTLPINESAGINHIHGTLKDAPFEILHMEQDRLVTALNNNGEYYPFRFRVEIEDRLSEDGLIRNLTLINTGKTPMPLALAYHTTFAEPEYFSVPIEKRLVVDSNHIPTGVLTELSQEQQAYRDRAHPDGRKISGFYTANGCTAVVGNYQFTVSKQFDHWTLFNSTGDAEYLCIEPQCGAVNGLNTDAHRILAPGQSHVFTIQIAKKPGEA